MIPRWFNFTLPGRPLPKARPRFTKAGHVYTDTKSGAYEKSIRVRAVEAMPDDAPYLGPISLHVEAVYKTPKSWGVKKTELALLGHIRPTGRPDWDNLGKIASDALNGVAYKDDAQVVHARVSKKYGTTDHIYVEVREIGRGIDREDV